ncbi:MAG TPA: DUF1634 domain-containing protein [Candidatus Limnocylindria bacterium]|nr:DUF1634 domain-containing protein [Candidatus Limnocylindria bacterium]
MSAPAAPPDMTRAGPLRRWVATVLTIGVWSSVALVAVGLGWAVVSGRPLEVARGSLLEELTAGEPGSVVLLGILLLVLTPIAQLVAAAAAFARNRERGYVIVTLVVLGVLVFSLVLAALTGGGAESARAAVV